MSGAPRTVAEIWRSAVAGRAAGAAYLVRDEEGWTEVGWEAAGREVEELAAAFLARGVRRGDRVAIVGRTRLEWVLCDWAAIAIGALVVPIYPTASAVESVYILGNCGARFVVCEDEAQREKVEPAQSELEALEQIFLFGELPELRERGRELLAADPNAVERERAAIGEDDPLTIVYTSGTTGPPKGCVLSQRNYHAMVESVLGVEGLFEAGDRILLYLPLAHTFARLVSFVGPAAGATIAFCPDVAGIGDALTGVRPTLFPSIPRLYERVAATVGRRLEEEGGVRGRVGRWAFRVGTRAGERRRAGKRPGPLLAVQRVAADRLVLARVRDRLGGRLRLAVSGGAALSRELAEFFHALGVLVLEGYGLTECTTAATFNTPDAFRFGTVGRPLAGVEVKIAEDGEVLVRGETVFQGYYRDEAATRDVLSPDGWLATGDVGRLDADGYLTLTDRKKDLIVTPAGENVSPQNLENALKASRFVSEAIVVGDRRPYLVALLALDDDEVGGAARTDAEVRALVEREVEEVNRGRPRFQQIRRFAILPRGLSLEARELTPTLKVRRHVCEEHFREEIEGLYPAGRHAP